MGREIKFRLIRDGKIIGYEKWYPGARVKETGLWTAQPKWLHSTDGEYWEPKPIRHHSKDQFTGLKDKNGVEIYEGDRINHGLFALNDRERFGEGPLPKGVNEDDITTILTRFEVRWDFRSLFDLKTMIKHNPDIEGVEIIGNIHEELLDG